MKKLQGKTIKSISSRKKGKDGNEKYEKMYIRFTDGSSLILTSWDYEGYSSGISTKIT